MTKTPFARRSIDTAMEPVARAVQSGSVPGAVVCIDVDGDVHLKTFGRLAFDGPEIPVNAIFRISSMTKPIVTAAAMALYDDGMFQLDDPVDRWLPELAEPRVLRSLESDIDDSVPARRGIIVRDLLNFCLGTGLVLAMPDTYPIQRTMSRLELGQGRPSPGGTPDPDEWMRRFASLPLIHHPGERWMYNTGADVLGVLISRVAGKPLPDVLSEWLFHPLGMRDTSFCASPEVAGRLATAYDVSWESGKHEIYDPPIDGQWNEVPAFPSGAGGLVATIEDCHRFTRMLQNGGSLNGQRILSKSTVELMTSNQLTPEQRPRSDPILGEHNSWGFGMAVSLAPDEFGMPAGSYGWSGGMGTLWITDPVNRIILLLFSQVNWTAPSYPALIQNFISAVYQAHD